MARKHQSFEKLRVYRLSEVLADEIWGIVVEWDSLPRDTVGKQLIRAADGIGANIAEGCGRWSYQDNRRFVRIARGSLNETRHFLRRAFRRKLLTEEQIATIRALLEDLPRTLNAYLSSIGRNDRPIRHETEDQDNAEDLSTGLDTTTHDQ
jgi:four helix bundle protein